LGDAYQSKLYDEDIEELLAEHPYTIGADLKILKIVLSFI